MAFLDNSGDIILDAVLTDEGRRRMAQGTFSVTKFALGDDEIDYSLYNKDHPSGSAYYDLEILQTPVFEAFTQINAGINYGLLPNTATDLLYLPTGKVNELATLPINLITSYAGVFYVRDTSGDGSATIVDRLGSTVASTDGTINPSSPFVLFETGLDTGFTAIPEGTSANRDSFLVANNLVDQSFYVYFDSRLFSTIQGPAAGSSFTNSGTSNTFNGNITLASGTPSSLDVGISNYASNRVTAVPNEVYKTTTNNTEQSYSVIGGPKAAVAGIAPVVKAGLNAEYTLYGSTGVSISGLSGTYDIIDTTIYVQGAVATLQIPFRIIRVRT
jgi:hypothetical protein|tara:strand:- start:2373 stop:3362 length:990 start_codon:yes stop_codon:yes gene_type:complete